MDLEGQLRRKFHIDVEVRNDMDFIAYGAYHTIYNGSANMAAVFFPSESEGTVGCGFVVNGKVLRGYTKFSGEVSLYSGGIWHFQKAAGEVLGDRDIFPVYAAQIVLIIIATLDPEEIVLTGNGFTRMKYRQSLSSAVRSYPAVISLRSLLPATMRIITLKDWSGHPSTESLFRFPSRFNYRIFRIKAMQF